MADNTCIKVCGQLFDTGTKVVLWDDPAGYSFYPKSKLAHKPYIERKLSLEELQKKINCFVIHHSVTFRVKRTFEVLVERNLSVNFSIDDDINSNGCATIYQFLDVRDAGYSQKELNEFGAGVEISYMPDAWDHPDRYSEVNIKHFDVQPHKIVTDTIHGIKKNVFGPTEAQVNACIRLIYGYSKAFPNLKLTFPRDKNGKFISSVAPDKTGLLHHFNITINKPDAMGFPTDHVEKEVNRLVNEEGLTREKVVNTIKDGIK